jgi:TRAP-type C4-dicarboxylate transport system permease small subunit
MLSNTTSVPRWVGAIEAALGLVSKLMIVLAAVSLVLIAVLIGADVFGRGLFNAPIIGVAEVVANGVVIIAFLQLPYTVRIGGMLRTEVMDMVAPRPVARLLWLAGYLLGAFFFALIAWAEWGHMINAWVTGEFEGHVSFAVPVFPSRLTIVVGSILAAITYLLMVVPAAIALFTGNEGPLNAIKGQEEHIHG